MMPNGEAIRDAVILVVEDSDEDFDTLLEAARFSAIDNSIVRADNGAACLEMLVGGRDIRLATLPAIILMDLNSYGLDGREALVAIKSTPSLKHIPVIVLTTSANVKDVAFCLKAGANAYHVKPVRHDQYLLLLQSLMSYWINSATLCTDSGEVQ
jgi:two-component system, response regulator